MSGYIDAVRSDLRGRLKDKTYGELASEMSVSKGALWKFLNTDYVPSGNELRRKLGLPEIIQHSAIRNDRGRFVKVRSVDFRD